MCQHNYFRCFRIQIYSLLFIAFLSLLPPSSEHKTEIIKRSLELISIIIVLLIMVWQYNQNYIKGWQNARYLAESILSNAWLFVWKCEPFNKDQTSLKKFINMIENLEKDVDLNHFLSLVPNSKDEIPDWMTEFRNNEIEDKKNNYMKYRLDDQIKYYSKEAAFNQKRSTFWFIAGLFLMVIGAILTILIIIGILPNISFLGFFTTAAASVFSWSQAKRNDEFKITYGVSAHELSRFMSSMSLTSDENELVELVTNIEKAISREHKLWVIKIS